MTLKGMEVCFKYIMLGIHPIHQKMSNIGRPDVYYDKQITDIFIYIYIICKCAHNTRHWCAARFSKLEVQCDMAAAQYSLIP